VVSGPRSGGVRGKEYLSFFVYAKRSGLCVKISREKKVASQQGGGGGRARRGPGIARGAREEGGGAMGKSGGGGLSRLRTAEEKTERVAGRKRGDTQKMGRAQSQNLKKGVKLCFRVGNHENANRERGSSKGRVRRGVGGILEKVTG